MYKDFCMLLDNYFNLLCQNNYQKNEIILSLKEAISNIILKYDEDEWETFYDINDVIFTKSFPSEKMREQYVQMQQEAIKRWAKDYL